MKHTKKHISCLIMIVLIIIFDRVTKYFAVKNLYGGDIVNFIPGVVQFRYAENTGMAFSMLSGARWVFVALTFAVCVGAFYYLFSNKCKSLWLYWSIGVVVSGGIGNLIDRARFGYVVDFIDLQFMDFAVFNFADILVTVGAFALMFYVIADIFRDRKKSGEKNE